MIHELKKMYEAGKISKKAFKEMLKKLQIDVEFELMVLSKK